MGKNLLVGVGSKARKVKALYVGVGGKARKVKKVYVGVGGKARLVYQSYIPVTGITLSWAYRSLDTYEKYPSGAVLTATVTPSNATNATTLTWSNSYTNGKTYLLFSGTGNSRTIETDVSDSNGTLYHYSGSGVITVSADGVSAKVLVNTTRYTDKDGEPATKLVVSAG